MPKVGSIRGSSKACGGPGRQGAIGKPNMPSGSARFSPSAKKLKAGRMDAHAIADQAKSKKP